MRSYRVFCMCAALLFLSACAKGPDLAANQVNDALAAVSELENGTYTAVSELVKITADGGDITSCSTEKGRFQQNEDDGQDWYVISETKLYEYEKIYSSITSYIDGEYVTDFREDGAEYPENVTVVEVDGTSTTTAGLKKLSGLFVVPEQIASVTREREEGGINYTFLFSEEYLGEMKAQNVATLEQSLAKCNQGDIPLEQLDLKAEIEQLLEKTKAGNYLSQTLTVFLDETGTASQVRWEQRCAPNGVDGVETSETFEFSLESQNEIGFNVLPGET